MEHITQNQCQLAREQCNKNNIEPLKEAILEIKEILMEVKGDVKEMKPSFRMVKDAEITAGVVGMTMKWVLFFFVFVSTIIGSIYGIKEWLKKD